MPLSRPELVHDRALERFTREESDVIGGTSRRYAGGGRHFRRLRRPAPGPAVGLHLVEALAERGGLHGSHLVQTVRGELLTRLGRLVEAKAALVEALSLCSNAAERSALERKIAELADQQS